MAGWFAVITYDILLIFIKIFPAILVLQFIRHLFGDCDLRLQWAEKFGKSIKTYKGKVVWITGASSGIGEHLAYKFAEAGAKLVLTARREAELNRVKQKCHEKGNCREEDVLVLPMDIVDYGSHEKCYSAVIEQFGVIDVLVSNAGISQRADWHKTELEVDKKIFEINVFGTINLTRMVLPRMLEQNQGQILVTSSVAGKMGVPFSASYSATKFALHGYFESLRIETLLGKDIGVTLVCPGPVYSDIRKNALTESAKTYGVGFTKNEPLIMSTERCAHLMAVALANNLSEVWISKQPILFFTYISQYSPDFARWCAKLVGRKMIARLRDRTIETSSK